MRGEKIIFDEYTPRPLHERVRTLHVEDWDTVLYATISIMCAIGGVYAGWGVWYLYHSFSYWITG